MFRGILFRTISSMPWLVHFQPGCLSYFFSPFVCVTVSIGAPLFFIRIFVLSDFSLFSFKRLGLVCMVIELIDCLFVLS